MAGAAPGGPTAAWKLLIWAVMSGEVAGAGPPTSFHSLPRVSCCPAPGTPVPARLRRLSSLSASASLASLPAALHGHCAPGSRWAGGGWGGRVCIWGIPDSWRPWAGRIYAAASLVTGRVTLGTAPPFSPAQAPALSFPPQLSGEGNQGSPGRCHRRGPASQSPALAAPRPGGCPSSSLKCALPALLPGASSAPGSPDSQGGNSP